MPSLCPNPNTVLFNSAYFMQIFDLMITEFPELAALQTEFEDYIVLWHTAWDFLKVLPTWLDGPISDLNAEEVQNNVEMWYKSSAKCAKVTVGEAKMVAEELKMRVGEFQVYFMSIFQFDILVLFKVTSLTACLDVSFSTCHL
jgi:hypothetical protein